MHDFLLFSLIVLGLGFTYIGIAALVKNSKKS